MLGSLAETITNYERTVFSEDGREMLHQACIGDRSILLHEVSFEKCASPMASPALVLYYT